MSDLTLEPEVDQPLGDPRFKWPINHPGLAAASCAKRGSHQQIASCGVMHDLVVRRALSVYVGIGEPNEAAAQRTLQA
jgi:hypothetical protein